MAASNPLPHTLQRALRSAWALPLAVALAISLVVISELSYRDALRSIEALGTQQALRLRLFELQLALVDAETGQRGFLLTGQPQYLQPYTEALKRLGEQMQALRAELADQPARSQQLAALLERISAKLSELQTTLKLYTEGREESWRALLVAGIGREHMADIRAASDRLIDDTRARIESQRAEVLRTLWLGRIGIVVVTLLTLGGFAVYLRQAAALDAARHERQQLLEDERDRLERQVRERTAELSELALHLQSAREDERNRLARELHDELGALLTAAKLDLARLKSRLRERTPELDERLDHLARALNDGIALKRRIIEDLRPSALANLGLVSALEILTREFAERSGVQVHVDLAPVALDAADELTVYRLVQEALTNVAKHAGATQVHVRLHRGAQGRAEVEVHDDGAGFDRTGVRSGAHGLLGMRHRVEAAGGRFALHSAPGQGTRIQASLPTRPGAGA